MTDTVPVKICEILNGVVNGNLDNFEIVHHEPNKKGEGYLGQIFFISLQHKTNGTLLNMVVKKSFSDENLRKSFDIKDVFYNEIYFYTKLWPRLNTFQEAILPQLRFQNVTKCFAGVSEGDFEALVLANLKFDGFVLHDKKKVLEKDQFEFIFKVYGRLHAMSFAYKALHPKEFSKMAEGLVDVWAKFIHYPSFQQIVKSSYLELLACLQPGVEDAIIEKWKWYIENSLELILKSFINGKYTCLTHGDCWSNNMMMKYDDSGKMVDLKLLDFQMTRLGSPIWDLSYCLYSGGTKEIFDDLDHFLQVYHSSLSENLRALGCDPDEICPLDTLNKDWMVFSQLGLAMGIILWRNKLVDEDTRVDLTDISDNPDDAGKFLKSKYDTEVFKQRSRDILFHFYENGYMF